MIPASTRTLQVLILTTCLNEFSFYHKSSLFVHGHKYSL
ncbi:unnamed protein product [Arabidopsis halleri]